jgi:hypothetical protein
LTDHSEVRRLLCVSWEKLRVVSDGAYNESQG